MSSLSATRVANSDYEQLPCLQKDMYGLWVAFSRAGAGRYFHLRHWCFKFFWHEYNESVLHGCISQFSLSTSMCMPYSSWSHQLLVPGGVPYECLNGWEDFSERLHRLWWLCYQYKSWYRNTLSSDASELKSIARGSAEFVGWGKINRPFEPHKEGRHSTACAWDFVTLQVDGFNSDTSNCPPIHFSTYTTLNSGHPAILYNENT